MVYSGNPGPAAKSFTFVKRPFGSRLSRPGVGPRRVVGPRTPVCCPHSDEVFSAQRSTTPTFQATCLRLPILTEVEP